MDTKIVLFGFTLFVLTSSVDQNHYKLQRVVILSRHNVRTPLANDLADITPKQWPQWKQKSGNLTPKGAYVEGLMGAFFSEWMNKEQLLPDHCPGKDDVFVYANIKQRTVASAHAFVDKAFPDCNVPVHINNETDPVFNPVIHNASNIFKQIALEQMQESLRSIHLNGSYNLIELFLDYKDSRVCKINKKCDLVVDKNVIKGFTVGKKPYISGPLKISKAAIDAFIMEYYEGFSLKNVAWGELVTENQWQSIMSLSERYHNIIFNTTILAKDLASPLVQYMRHVLLNEETKFTLLMGHDANMFTILSSMNFKPYSLPEQYEKSPIGGKIVFQKWLNILDGKSYLKVHFVYASTKQIRNSIVLNLKNMPKFQLLEINKCNLNDEGFCLWDDFEKLLVEL